MNAIVQSANHYKVVTKITRADLGLSLPRLDMDQQPNLSDDDLTAARAKVAELSKAYAHVYDVGGFITKTKLVKGKGDQDGVQFIGEFRAVLALPNRVGERFYSGRVHVPKMIEEILYAQVAQALQIDENAKVGFLIRVGIKPPKPGKPSAVGYEWTVEPLVEAERPSDPLETLFNSIPDAKRLAAASSASTTSTPVSETPALEHDTKRHGNGRK